MTSASISREKFRENHKGGCTDIRKFESTTPASQSVSVGRSRFVRPVACDARVHSHLFVRRAQRLRSKQTLSFLDSICVPGPPHLQQTGRRYTRALVGHGSHAGQRYFVTDRKRWTERFTWSCGAREVVATGSSIRPADFRHGRWRRLGLSRRRNPLMALFPHGLAWFISSREAHDVPILGINLISPNPPPHASPPAPPDSLNFSQSGERPER